MTTVANPDHAFRSPLGRITASGANRRRGRPIGSGGKHTGGVAKGSTSPSMVDKMAAKRKAEREAREAADAGGGALDFEGGGSGRRTRSRACDGDNGSAAASSSGEGLPILAAPPPNHVRAPAPRTTTVLQFLEDRGIEPLSGTRALPNNVVKSTFGTDVTNMGERRKQDARTAMYAVGRASMANFHPQGGTIFEELVGEAESARQAAAEDGIVALANEKIVAGMVTSYCDST